MQWSQPAFRPSDQRLRQFACFGIVFLGAPGLWREWHGERVSGAALLMLALTMGPLGLLKPAVIRPIYVGWMMAAFPIGWVVARSLLAAVYYAVFTPLALLFRMIDRDPLGLGPGSQTTYWAPKPTATEPEQYLRPF
jgi:Saxitoxin biosynthesis operon protein SxtJ